MRSVRAIAAAALLLATGAAHAGVSGTTTAASDYDFRGISQSATDPALQASLDWAHDSGFYLGAWGSNVDFGDCCEEDIEVDVYAGFSRSLDSGVSWNAGFVYYLYPGASYEDAFGLDEDLHYWEVSVGGGFKNFSTKFWYSDNFANFEDISGESASAWYLEANYTIPLPQDFAIGLHAGKSDGDYWGDNDYFDYSVSVSKALGHFNLSLKYIYPDVEDTAEVTDDVFNNEDRVLFSVATTFPWGSE
jgi:uncharacterized protein (TIGR02001 family)